MHYNEAVALSWGHHGQYRLESINVEIQMNLWRVLEACCSHVILLSEEGEDCRDTVQTAVYKCDNV